MDWQADRRTETEGEVGMKEIIIEVPDDFGKTLKPEKVNSEIKGELVRCKDCKHWDAKKHECHNTHSYMQYRPCFQDWFCADGEKR